MISNDYRERLLLCTTIFVKMVVNMPTTNNINSVRYRSRYVSVHLVRFTLGEGGNFP